MARRDAHDLVPLQKQIKLEGLIDLELIPDRPSATTLEDEDDDNYIQDIPGVMTFGVKRARPNHSAPPKFQTVTPWNTIRNLLPKDFSTTEKTVTALVNIKGDTAGTESVKVKREPKALSDRENSGKVKKEQKAVSDREQLRLLYESLNETISTQKLEFTKLAHGFQVVNAEKDGQITRLQSDVSDLKHSLLVKSREREVLLTGHDRKISDMKEELIREIECLKDSFREQTECLKDSFREQTAEKEGTMNRQKREIEDLKTSFSIEKALIEDRHRQQMAAYRSAILTVVLSQTTQNQEAQSSVVQVTIQGTSGGVGKQ